jgi:Lrp/AsnC family transcriptional regulator, leucine-responsive regulatory protein
VTQLDEIDWKILATLQKSSNLPNTELADQVGLTPAPCLRRVKNLSQLGIIQGYSIALDNKQLGYTLSALAKIRLTQHTAQAARKFIRAIQGKREIIACHMVTGDCDFILRIMSPDIDAYRKLIWEELHGIEGVLEIHSSVILETFKDQLSPMLDGLISKR